VLSFRAQGRTLKVSFGRSRPYGSGGRRGVVSSFSKASRKRMLDKFGHVDLSHCGRPLFITLTYGQVWPNNELAKRHLDNFFKRLRRRFPTVSGFWRMEFQNRGAVHFHIVLFNLTFFSKRSLCRVWGDVVGRLYWDNSTDTPRPPFTRVERLQSARKGFAYLAKYLAKVPEAPAEDSAVGLTMSHNSPPSPSVGRFWGLFNRRCVPFSPPLHFKWLPFSSSGYSSLLSSLCGLGSVLSGGFVRPYEVDETIPFGFTVYNFDDNLYDVLVQIWYYLNGTGGIPEWFDVPPLVCISLLNIL